MRIIYSFLFTCISIYVHAQSTQELIDIGHRNYELGEYQEAIDYLNKAADKDQKNPEIFYLLGVCKS
ncbi:MAG: tetratricopeptide repeat protein, partial [Fulvivirga sp.]